MPQSNAIRSGGYSSGILGSNGPRIGDEATKKLDADRLLSRTINIA
jgi:hypothetical protein